MRLSVLTPLLLVFCITVSAATEEEQSLAGYSPEGARSEREWEKKFQAIPNSDNEREYMKRLAARPHHVGSAYDKDNAEWMVAKLKGWGLEANIENFDVL